MYYAIKEEVANLLAEYNLPTKVVAEEEYEAIPEAFKQLYEEVIDPCREPVEGENYFHINKENFEVKESIHEGQPDDDRYIADGNYFWDAEFASESSHFLKKCWEIVQKAKKDNQLPKIYVHGDNHLPATISQWLDGDLRPDGEEETHE